MSINNIVAELKNRNEDFEFYPTTQAMLERICEVIGLNYNIDSILDIGAGDGKVLAYLGEKYRASELLAIEKSEYLKALIDKNVMVVGSDFLNTTLIDKQVDILFCNPPYSIYELWTSRILREANANYIVLVIPNRWNSVVDIKEALELREAMGYNKHIIEGFDFLNAEREARAKVDILILQKTSSKDIFADFLDREFGFDKIDSDSNYFDTQKRLQTELEDKTSPIPHDKLIDFLVDDYNKKIKKFNDSLHHLSNINPMVLDCIDIDKNKLTKGIIKHLRAIKNLYWKELLNKLEAITTRIPPAYNHLISAEVISKSQVDFTKENIYNIVIWVIENSNHYINKGLLGIFDTLSSSENVRKYKSNERFDYDNWRYSRYNEEKPTHYKLDYRIIATDISGIKKDKFSTTCLYARRRGEEMLYSLRAIARILGYNLGTTYQGTNRERHLFYDGILNGIVWASDDKGNDTLLIEMKAYKNGNVHFKFDIEFWARFNIAVGKLRGWIRDKQEAREVFNDIDSSIVDEAFTKTLSVGLNEVKLLGEIA